DYQLTNTQTLVGRYAHTRQSAQGVGVGNFVLPERAYDADGGEHLFQLSHTAALGKRAFNETRLQHVRERRSHEAATGAPAVSVLDAFEGGGAQVGRSSVRVSRWELQNHTTVAFEKHALKFGGQLRFASARDASEHNFNGTYVFAGGLAPRLDAAGEVMRDGEGQPLLAPVTSAERYRRTLLFASLGLAPASVRERGGGASQFYVAGGEASARVSQWEAGLFVQNDWRVRPELMLSAGLRFETQTNLAGSADFAPRLAFAWSPDGAKGNASTVLRGGVGLFYERFNRDYTLRARRLDGTRQRQFIVSDPALLDIFPAVPPASSLEAFALPQSTARVSEDLRAPYTFESSVSVERQLTQSLTVSAAYTRARTLHALRSRNLNAPLPGTFARPFDGAGEIFAYESSGRVDRNQLSANVVTRLGKRLTFYATYVLAKTEGNTDGADTFPVNSYDAAGEYARASTDARHGFYLGGWVEGPWGIGFSTLVFARSGLPFNVTTGRDANFDSVFNERPALASDLTRPSVVVTRFGAFDLEPLPGQRVIPRNYANGPGFASVNLSASKTFAFGHGAGDGARKYHLTLSANVENLLNRTNPSTPVGNLSSDLFGRSQTSAGSYGLGQTAAGNRRLSVQVAFRF
ncbi:MAG TPA: hypothetical protein VGV38_00300, partial [Pyrinomonadaceae bacterium]|nr:hypothetical protein [Pyrinomonadaceae bacterium]